MRSCQRIHEEYDRHASGDAQVGRLPDWMHVDGKVVLYAFQGPYSGLSKGWDNFMQKVAKMTVKVAGPPGDVYVCDPLEHKGEEQSLLTILWAPLKE